MTNRQNFERIAVVGMGCVLPDAKNPEEFWHNILSQKVSIGPVERRRLDADVYYRPEAYGKIDKHDKSYTNLAALVKDIGFDPGKYRIPPAVAEQMDDNQKVALIAADQALANVSLERIERERISVFMGNTMIGEKHHEFQLRVTFQKVEHYLAKSRALGERFSADERDTLVRELRSAVAEHTQPITEDSAPGVLPNIIAARIASVFDFHGHAFVVDAACASSLAAIICGVQHLVSGESDAVVCGAADLLALELGHIYFSGINALSPDGSRPFDETANGFVIGQGAAAVVLKRMCDALRDGDPILAVIAGYGQTSDGKGKAIAAPNPIWQAKTIQRAMEMANFPADTVELIEAHGTATKVGDKSEIEALKSCFRDLGAVGKGFCAVGSVKSNIGHLKSAAGIASFLKVVQALRHKTLPPTANCRKVNSKLGIEDSPFYVITNPKPWQEKDHPRRAGVSAFGFGGANYHIALEEFCPSEYRNTVATPRAAIAVPGSAALAASQMVLFSGATRADLLDRARGFLARLRERPGQTPEVALEESYRADANRDCRLAVVFDSSATFEHKLSQWQAAQNPQGLRVLRTHGVFYCESAPRTLAQTAFLFPGQGSQYADMVRDIPLCYPGTQRIAARIDAWWKDRNGTTVSSLISSASRGKEATEKLLRNTRNTHPALLYSNLVHATLLQDMGVRPGWMIGHSAGEVVALAAAGKLSLEDALTVIDDRSRAFAEMKLDDFGKMAAIHTNRPCLEGILTRSALPIVIANINSPDQLIVSGSSAAIDALCAIAKQESLPCVELNVSHAFHSPIVAAAAERLGRAIQEVAFAPGHARVMANETCAEYPDTDVEIRRLLQSQVTASVNFYGGIDELYRRGVRVFVEAGPNSILGKLVQAILKDRDATVVSVDSRNADSLESINKALAALFAEGISVQIIPPARMIDQEITTEPNVEDVSTSPSRQPVDANPRMQIVYSGVSVGLPGSYKKSFQDDNFAQLFAGHNFIERLADSEKSALADLRVTKVEKTEQGPAFRVLESLEDVIQLAGRIGKIDPLVDYALDPKETAHVSSVILHAVAAGYEALRDAHIPLVREYARTASGKLLPEGWVLPQEMQKRTGVVFAHGFPMVETVIAEVSRHVGYKFGHRLRRELLEFYETLLGQIRDQEAKKLLTDWFALHHHRLSQSPSGDEVYSFNHHFIQQISALANNRLASYVRALGPNFQINAACSSTSTAITLAEDMIRSGRADRFLVIGADDATSTTSLPYLGAGFLSTGAATCEADLYKAALPFDLRRNGMIMSAGAVGIVVEAAEQVRARGVTPVCELLGSHVFNTAGHHARLDVPCYAEELDRFLVRMEETHGISRAEIAPRLLYVSHEPYTPSRGGCSEAETVALRHAFGSRAIEIEVTNTKGMTGHTMGASIEDVVAARALQTGQTPPVVNHQVVDPGLAGLKLSRGGSHACEFALRMAAGFGSQGNYVLLRKFAGTPDRIVDSECHARWLSAISGQASPEVEHQGRVLRVKDKAPDAHLARHPAIRECLPSAPTPSIQGHDLKHSATSTGSRLAAASVVPMSDDNAIARAVLDVVSAVTGYPPDKLALDMEIEADLGVDTVKQATILATLADRFGRMADSGFQISAYPTLGHIVRLFSAEEPQRAAETVAVVGTAPTPVPNPTVRETPVTADAIDETMEATVLEVVSEITGYAPDKLDIDMEIEADLGVDTVKQATILATLADRFGRVPNGGFQISAYPTIGHIVRLFGHQPSSRIATTIVAAETVSFRPAEQPVSPPLSTTTKAHPSLATRVLEGVAELTGYPPEMLELDMEIGADLGVDNAKHAEVLATLGERFGRIGEGGFQISAYPTIGHIVRLFAAEEQESTPTVAKMESVGTSAARPDNITNLTRQILSLEDDPLNASREALDVASIWILGEHTESLTKIAQSLAPLCGAVWTLLLPKDGDPTKAVEVLAALEGHSADLWIDLGSWGRDTCLADLAQDEAEREIARAADCRFALCKHMQVASWSRPRRVLAVASTSLDPLGGLRQGFYQSLGKEWNLPVTLVEVEGISDCVALAEKLSAELSQKNSAARISYRDGRRQSYRVVDAPFEPAPKGQQLELTANDAVLVTGGGNGIASRVLLAMAKQFPCRFVVVGRTALGKIDFTDGNWDDDELPHRKADLELSLAKSGARVTPALLEKEFSQSLKRREVSRMLKAVRDVGREIHYVAADVANFHDLQSALAPVLAKMGKTDKTRKMRKAGKVNESAVITAVIHAAGIEISRLLEKKTLEEFTGVHRVKTVGAVNLARLCPPESLKLFVAFTSISGVFGNKAQLDYSSANAFLDAWVRFLAARHPGLRAVSLAWSGWRELGMAWRNAFVREHAESMGLGLIAPTVGVAATLREFEALPETSPVILHRGLGEMLDDRWKPRRAAKLPLIDRIEQETEDAVRAFHRFSVEEDEFLNQHRLNKVPLVPGVGFMEFMAELHSHVEPAQECVRFNDLSFHDAFKLYRDQPREAFIQAEREESNGTWNMRVFSRFTTRATGEMELRDYCAARVTTGCFESPAWEKRELRLGEATQVAYSQVLSHLDRIPQNVVFGPLFHDSRRPGGTEPDVVVSWNEGEIHSPYRLPLAQIDNPRYPLGRYRLNPCLLDSIHQTGVIHATLRSHSVHLPVGAEEFVVVGKQERPGTYEVHAKLIDQAPNMLFYDIVLFDDVGRICAWVKRSAYHRIGT